MSATPSTSKDTKDAVSNTLTLSDKISKTEGIDNLNLIPKTDLKVSTDAVTVSTTKGEIIVAEDVNTKPEVKPLPQVATKDLIAQQLLRFLPRKLTKPKVSTYVPIALNYYQVISYMDRLICENTYFKSQTSIWHPLISRMYFGALLHYQTLRASTYAKVNTLTDQIFVAELEKSIPPEKLPIPGPLVPMLKSLCACSPTDDTYGIVTPILPTGGHPRNSNALVPTSNELRLCANNMFTNGLMKLIVQAGDEDEIPDFSTPGALAVGEDINILGHTFAAAWTRIEKDAFLQPSSIFLPETNSDWDLSLYDHAQDYDLIIFEDNQPIPNMFSYCGLSDPTWLDKIVPIMSTYCKFFKDSSNLGACSPYGPPTSLVRSRLTTLTSTTAINNIVNTIDQAFPNRYPLKLIYDHRSYEVSIPQIHQMMAQYSSFNTMINYRGLHNWSSINIPDEARTGPYWLQDPSYMICHRDDGISSIDNIIKEYYYIDVPKE